MPMLCHRCHDLLLVCRCFAIATISCISIILFSWNYALVYVQVWAEPGPFARQTFLFAGNWCCMTTERLSLAILKRQTFFFGVYYGAGAF
jgi:hypothetical protein